MTCCSYLSSTNAVNNREDIFDIYDANEEKKNDLNCIRVIAILKNMLISSCPELAPFCHQCCCPTTQLKSYAFNWHIFYILAVIVKCRK